MSNSVDSVALVTPGNLENSGNPINLTTSHSARQLIQSMKAVLLDVDGTILNSWPAVRHTLVYLLERYQPGASHGHLIEREMAGLSYRELFYHAFQTRQISEEIFREGDRYYAAESLHSLALYPDAEVFLEELSHKQIPWGLVTSKRRTFMDQVFTLFPCLQSAVCVITEEDVIHLKPHPEPILKGIEHLKRFESLKCLPDRVVYIGDSWVDMSAARSAGVKALWMQHLAPKEGFSPRSCECPCDAIAWGFGELLRV